MNTVCINRYTGKLTRNRKVAASRRMLCGERTFISFADKCAKTAATIKLSFAERLYDNIADDVMNGEEGGSYYLDGTPATSGFTVGGAKAGNRKAEELVLSGDEVKDRANVEAAIELMADEVAYCQQFSEGHEVVIGFWVEFGEVFFDASVIFYDEKEAAEFAFKRNNEWAYYDLDNQATVFLEDYLLKNDMDLDSFVAFKSATRRYRIASYSQQHMMKHTWFLHRF